LNKKTGKDGNFALISASWEPPTGDKDYAAFKGPSNAIFAGMVGFEWSELSAVALGYYRLNTADDAGSKKGNNWLAALGLAYTPIDTQTRMLSFQLGLAAEVHDRDLTNHVEIASGGWEILASPTLVWMPAPRLRLFTYVSLPLVQDYATDAQLDRWRASVGAIYAFELSRKPPAPSPAR
jgi:hypothetical protein